MTSSLIGSLASLPDLERAAILASLTDQQAEEILWDWRAWARAEQIAPCGDWLTWVIDAGRGFGKTRAGAEWVREQVDSGKQRIALIGETYKDLVEVMCFGDSGLASVFPPHQKPKIVVNPNVQVQFHTGAIALGYNATQPAQLRGPQFDAAWCDELAKWQRARETWDMLQFGLRLGEHPRALVTTTPRPIAVLKEILADPTTVATRGSTFDNTGNLSPTFIRRMREKYSGTRLGRQELDAEMLDDVQGALWTREMIKTGDSELVRIVVAVDPSGSDGDPESGADEIGIIVAGKTIGGGFHILEDATCSLSPAGWGRRAISKYKEHGAALIVAERNFGGEMVRSVIKSSDQNANVKLVTASRGKAVRAEPVASLYEQGKVTHAAGLDELEDQMMQMTLTGYVGEGSPDRLDAAVWAISELMEGSSYSLTGAL